MIIDWLLPFLGIWYALGVALHGFRLTQAVRGTGVTGREYTRRVVKRVLFWPVPDRIYHRHRWRHERTAEHIWAEVEKRKAS